MLETAEFLLELEELNKHIGLKKDDKETFLSYSAFRDDLIARQTHGKYIPEDLMKFYEKADLLAGMELASVFEYVLSRIQNFTTFLCIL